MTRTCTTTQTWHRHNGGPCPVDPAAPVFAIFSWVATPAYLSAASNYKWREIIAYTTDIPVVEFGPTPERYDHADDAMRLGGYAEKYPVAARIDGLSGVVMLAEIEARKTEPTRGEGCENEILP